MQFSKVRKGYMSDRKKEQAVERALTEGYEKYYRLAYSYVHNEADALDIVQEAAYKAILKSDSLKEPQYVETWVYRIVVNEACSFLRSRKESTDVDEIQAASEDTYEIKAYHKRYPNSKLFVITMDEEETIIYEAVVIEVLPVWKWLLMEK